MAARNRWWHTGASVLLFSFTLAYGQQGVKEDSQTSTKKSASGVEISILEVKKSDDYFEAPDILQFRMGACPPGSALGDVKIEADRGADVILVLYGLRFPASYGSSDLPVPVLMDDAGKTHATVNMFKPPDELVPRLKQTGEQLKCEVPFQLPAGIKIIKLAFGDLSFDVKVKDPQPQ